MHTLAQKKTFLQKLDGTNPTHPRKFRRPCNMIGMIYGPTFNSDNKIPRGWKIQTDIIPSSIKFKGTGRLDF